MFIGVVAKLKLSTCWEDKAQHSALEIDTFYGAYNFALWRCFRKTTTLALGLGIRHFREILNCLPRLILLVVESRF
jgi:hypothetical protein